VWIYTGNKLAKFHGNILSPSENIAESLRGSTFLTHTVEDRGRITESIRILVGRLKTREWKTRE